MAIIIVQGRSLANLLYLLHFGFFILHFFVTDRGMGLAMWRSEESYLDVQYIVGMVDEDTFTALHNPGLNECKDSACDGKLVRLIH